MRNKVSLSFWVKRVAVKLRVYGSYCVSLPLSLFFILGFPWIKYRFVKLCSDRIGHFALNTELLLCAIDDSEEAKRYKYLFYICSKDVPLCNEQLYRMWKRTLPIIPFSTIASQIDHFLLKKHQGQYKSKTIQKQESAGVGCNDVEGFLGKSKAHLFFTSEEHRHAQLLLNQLGIPSDGRYICLLVRDSEYLDKHLPGYNWSYHNYRDADIDTYRDAALFLAEKGYYVIRMGKNVSKKFNLSHSHIIDYANHALSSDFLDIYLSAHCYFFISTSSGLDGVAQIFRRPILFTNLAPLQQQLQYWPPCELVITKKIKDTASGRLLSFHEINTLFPGISANVLERLKENHVQLLDNTSDEILAVVQEMEARLNNTWCETEQDQILQRQFKKLLPFAMVISNDELIKNPQLFYIKLGASFLREYNALIEQ